MRGSACNDRSTIANRLTVASWGRSSSTSTIVEPSAETPAGTGSRPIVGRRHAPAIDWPSPFGWNPWSAGRSSTWVVVCRGSAVTTLAHVGSGAPSGKLSISSIVLARMMWTRSSPGRPTASHQSGPVGSTNGGSVSAAAADGAAADGAIDGDGLPGAALQAASIATRPRLRNARPMRVVVDISSPALRCAPRSNAHPSYTGSCAEVPGRLLASVQSIDSATSTARSRPSDVSRRYVISPSAQSRTSPTQRRESSTNPSGPFQKMKCGSPVNQ